MNTVVDRLIDKLHRHTVDLDDPGEGHLGLPADLRDHPTEQFDVERPIAIADVDVLRDGDRVIRREAFREPHAALSGRQLE